MTQTQPYSRFLQDIRAMRRPVVLVGLMGVGKTQTGRKLADHMNWPFVDADEEIERTAGCAISEIFDRFGEPKFRDLERRVITTLLNRPHHIIATGGGAFIQPDTRAIILEKSVSIWLRAALPTLIDRTAKSKHRPLLQNGNPADILARLMHERYPLYALADIVVDTDGINRWQSIDAILQALHHHAQNHEQARHE